MGKGSVPAPGTPRRHHSSQFKAKVALAAVSGQKTLSELASEFGVHPVQIAQWKRQLVDASAGIFESGNATRREREHEHLHQALGYQTPAQVYGVG